MTLTGKTGYEAKKVWLDQGVEEKNRPTGEFQLWRYREGENYTTAAPVRDEKGDFYTCDLDTEKDEFTVEFNIEVDVQEELGLEKYDSEGYRYFYVSREYLNATNKEGKPADNYEQVFGAVSAVSYTHLDVYKRQQYDGSDGDHCVGRLFRRQRLYCL